MSRNYATQGFGVSKTIQIKRLSSASTVKNDRKMPLITTIYDPIGAIGDPASFSLEKSKRAEKKRKEAIGEPESLFPLEKIRLREMILAETQKIKEAVNKAYPDIVKVQALKPLL